MNKPTDERSWEPDPRYPSRQLDPGVAAALSAAASDATLRRVRASQRARRNASLPRLTKREWVLINSALAMFSADLQDEEWGDGDNAFYARCWEKVQARITQDDINRGWHRDTGTCSNCYARVPTKSLRDGECEDCWDKHHAEEED